MSTRKDSNTHIDRKEGGGERALGSDAQKNRSLTNTRIEALKVDAIIHSPAYRSSRS